VVLDACAGIGGKTGHIAQLMKNRGEIIAMDNHQGRLAVLRAQMKRLRVTIVQTYKHDLLKPLQPQPFGSRRYDRVLLDAPCSGSGVIRRNPDVKWRLSQNALIHYGRRQLQLLDRVSDLVKPAGLLVYAVCSTESEETDDVLQDFLSLHPEFQISISRSLPFNPAIPSIYSEGVLKTLPHRHQMDGFFAVGLRRIP
jgi:16S rRNA (cytosine967-C5)-methyltransferase